MLTYNFGYFSSFVFLKFFFGSFSSTHNISKWELDRRIVEDPQFCLVAY